MSDNGTQFTSEDTQRFVASKGSHWKFNVAGAPWWNGLVERMVRSTKRCLRKCFLKKTLTFNEVSTILAEVELVTNNRPLTHTYEELGETLTPKSLAIWKKIKH